LERSTISITLLDRCTRSVKLLDRRTSSRLSCVFDYDSGAFSKCFKRVGRRNVLDCFLTVLQVRLIIIYNLQFRLNFQCVLPINDLGLFDLPIQALRFTKGGKGPTPHPVVLQYAGDVGEVLQLSRTQLPGSECPDKSRIDTLYSFPLLMHID
jgi:hypothetical protein